MNRAIVQTAGADGEIGWPAVLAYQIYVEIVKTVRVPMFAVLTLVLPTLLFAMFGLPSVDEVHDGVNAGRFMMASFGTYAIMGVALFSFGVAIASERGMGWNRLLRATPLRPTSLFVAKIAMAALFGLAALAVLYLFAAFVGHVSMELVGWCSLIGLLLVGMIPFVALGLWLGYIAGPSSAPVIANLMYLPLAFASGLFVPVEGLPPVVRSITPYLPSYHIAQLGWTYLGAGDGVGIPGHLLWLTGFTVVFLVLARWAYQRDEGRAFG